MAKSIHDLVHGLDVDNSIEEVIEATEEATGRLSGADDKLRDMITQADEVKENFEDMTIKDLQNYIEQLGVELQELKDEIY